MRLVRQFYALLSFATILTSGCTHGTADSATSTNAADPLGYYVCAPGCNQKQADLKAGDAYGADSKVRARTKDQYDCLHDWQMYYYALGMGMPNFLHGSTRTYNPPKL